MASTHVLMLPCPWQGHVLPMMELAHSLVQHGFRVTFVNTEFTQAKVLEALPNKGSDLRGINLVSVPDGLSLGDDRDGRIDLMFEGFYKVTVGHLEQLIRKTNEKEEEEKKIKWLIADKYMGWSFAVGKKMGLRIACFWPASTAGLALMLSIPNLIKDRVVDGNGSPVRDEIMQIAPNMPHLHHSQFSWNQIGHLTGNRVAFKVNAENIKHLDHAEIIVCNSFYEIESGAYTLFPNLIPIGPLVPDPKFKKSLGVFWPEDTTCMTWLDKQPPKSVIYLAFGSVVIFSEVKFKELAHGLELTGRPFLWVVRPDFTTGLSKEWINGFLKKNEKKGRIVTWAPQQRVLSHESVACFISHCGWNSTLEGMRSGLPFLCWPYFDDQFSNQSYICDIWRIGLRMEPDENGVVSRDRVRDKVEELVASVQIEKRAQELKELAWKNMKVGGTSYENFKRFVKLLHE